MGIRVTKSDLRKLGITPSGKRRTAKPVKQAELSCEAESPNSFVAVLDLPPIELSENQRRRLHWSKIAKATREYKDLCYHAYRSMKQQERMGFPWHDAYYEAVFYFPNKRRMLDEDNAKSGLKPALDALESAGFIVNDKFLCAKKVLRLIDTEMPRLVLWVQKLQDDVDRIRESLK
jgi:hypothetical protein